MTTPRRVLGLATGLLLAACAAGAEPQVRLITLDPGHFHAGLLQKTMYAGIDPTVYVYAPFGDDVGEHLKRVQAYNARPDRPTDWREEVYLGPDYFERMMRERPGNVVMMSGSNRGKTARIREMIDAGLNVFGDKPLAIEAADFDTLREAFADARKRGVVLYDIMTERSEIATVLQRELSGMPEVFGRLQEGTADRPAVEMESVHFYYKSVSGVTLKRPAWFFDVAVQGEGMVDVGTHLVDLVQWECFPGESIDWARDVRVLAGAHWPTAVTEAQFRAVTGLPGFPDFLRPAVRDGALQDYANGRIDYTIRGVRARVTARWAYQAPPGCGDTHYSVLRGTRCELTIRQGAEEGYQPTLYVEPAEGTDRTAFAADLAAAVGRLQADHPGVGAEPAGRGWRMSVPKKYDVGHEAHFAEVMERFLGYVRAGRVPDWEEAGMIAKYYTTTKGLALARRSP